MLAISPVLLAYQSCADYFWTFIFISDPSYVLMKHILSKSLTDWPLSSGRHLVVAQEALDRHRETSVTVYSAPEESRLPSLSIICVSPIFIKVKFGHLKSSQFKPERDTVSSLFGGGVDFQQKCSTLTSDFFSAPPLGLDLTNELWSEVTFF